VKKQLHFNLIHLLVAATLLAALLSLNTVVHAQAGTAQDLINEINAMRTANGQEAYTIDPNLMAVAQSHSEYQASIDTCTHKRADGSGPEAYGISAENIACGKNLTIQAAVYSQWADDLHRSTILGPTTGSVGAGVAVKKDKVYYTLVVKRGSGSFTITQPASSGTIAPANTKPTATTRPPLVTATARPDGMIIHVVQSGQTALEIALAYEIKLDDLYSYNNIKPQNPVIYPGNRLIIRYAFTPTTSPTITDTPLPPTRTATVSRTPAPTRTPTPYRSQTSTRAPTPQAINLLPAIGNWRQALGLIVLGVSLIGLLYVLISAVMPRKKS